MHSRESVGKVRVAGRKRLNRCVRRTLIGNGVLNVLHTRHFRHLDFDTTRASTAGGNLRGHQIEGTHRDAGRQIKVVRIPIGGRIGRGTRRLGFRLHHIVALGQIEERHTIIGTRGTLRLNDRVLVIEFVELKGGFRKTGGTDQGGLHTTTCTRTTTGGCTAHTQSNILSLLR